MGFEIEIEFCWDGFVFNAKKFHLTKNSQV
jgi:hypothetical protein